MDRIGRKYRLLILLIGLFVILGCKSCMPMGMEFNLTAAPAVFTGPGETITYSYSLKNINSKYFDFGINDDRFGTIPCASTRLEAGAAITCQFFYSTTAQDVAAGVIRNNAGAKAVIPGGEVGWFDVDAEEAVQNDSVEVVYELPQCQLALEKYASPTAYMTAGQVIQYTYQIHNTGYAEVSGPFAMTDDKVDEWTCDNMGAGFNLCINCFTTCRGTYIVKASEVGSNITNTAQAQATCATTSQAVRSNADSATVIYLMPTPTSQAVQPQLTVTVSVNQTVYTKTGEVIVYTYAVQNTGQAAVNGPFELVDEKADQWECDPADSLPAGGQLICKGYYRIRENDLCSSVTNTAHVKGTFQGTPMVSNQVSVSVYSGRNCNKPNPNDSDSGEPGPPPVIIVPWD